TTRGRIYRLAPKGNKPSVPAVDLENYKGIVEALASPAQSVRYMAIQKIRSLDRDWQFEIARRALIGKTSGKSLPWLRARTLWLGDHHPEGYLFRIKGIDGSYIRDAEFENI